MTEAEVMKALKEIEVRVDKKQYNEVIYMLCKIVSCGTTVYNDITLDSIRRPVTGLQLLIRLYEAISTEIDDDNAWKGLLCIYIATCLNNLTIFSVAPQKIESIRLAIQRQKIAISYFNKGMYALNKSGFMLDNNINNSFNYSLCIIEFNYILQLTTDGIGVTVKEEINSIYNRIKDRLDALIGIEPNNKAYKLTKANLVEFKEGNEYARPLYKDITQPSKEQSIDNIIFRQFREAYQNKRHLAVIYKM